MSSSWEALRVHRGEAWGRACHLALAEGLQARRVEDLYFPEALIAGAGGRDPDDPAEAVQVAAVRAAWAAPGLPPPPRSQRSEGTMR